MPDEIIVLTPVYNGEEVLPKFLRKVAEQDMPYYHIFVTNNCTDRSNEIIDEYLGLPKSTARKVRCEKGERTSWDYPADFTERMENPYAGIAIAQQWGFRRAGELMEDGPFKHLLFTDDDTIPLDPGAFSTIVAWGVDIIGGSYLRDFPEGRSLSSKWIENGVTFTISHIEHALMEPHVTSSGFLCLSRKVVLDKRLHWWPIYHPPDKAYGKVANDFGFCLLARKHGYDIFLDGIITLEHLVRQRDRPWMAGLKPGKYVPFRFKGA